MKNSLCRGWLAALLLAVPLLGAANGDLQLIESAKNSDYQAVLSLLEKSVDVNVAKADGTTALHWAVLRDDQNVAKLLIQFDADPTPANDLGVTPLWLACTNRSADMVTLLLQARADPNAALSTGETVLMNCSRTGATAAVASLLSAGAKVNGVESSHGQTALMWAVAGGHPDVARLLIDHGANISASTTATEPTYSYYCDICEWGPSPGGFTPLLFAARSGNLETARLLLDAGADPNEATAEDGNSLVITSAGGHEALALYLLEMGANPNSTGQTGITALHHAVGTGLSYLNGVIYDPVYRLRPTNSMKLARALLEAGADVNARIKSEHLLGPDGYPFSMEGATPLLLAAASVDIPMMNLLREFDADAQINTQEGITPLMAATQAACTGTCAYQQGGNVANKNDIEAALRGVEASLEMGVDINSTSKEGQTAMHIAAFTGADAIVQHLADHGAEINVKTKDGETPWSMASGISPLLGNRGLYGVHESTIKLLLKLGAKETPVDELTMSLPNQ